MSEVFIPLGGAGGKNRGTAAVLGDSTPFSNAGAVMSLPLPAGNYKKSVSNPRTSYGDGKNSELTISKELLKKMAIEAFGIASITNFSATMYAHKQVRLTWARPTKGLWSGTFFVFKKGRMPNSVYDSDAQYASGDTHLVTQPLSEGIWYIRAFNYVATNNGRWYDDGKVSYMINVTGISGSVTLGAGAGTWTVPANVYKIRYILVGHGGDAGRMFYTSCATGGGGGGYFTTGYMNVTPGQALPWVVPTATGQPTVLNGITANSGTSGNNATYENINVYGGAGGSGGGAAYVARGFYGAGCGGTDGGDGQEAWYFVHGRGLINNPNLGGTNVGGTGQHTSTRGFNGVLYSGGGGGGGGRANDVYPNKGAGLGGPGGGGNCTANPIAGETEAAGTDGLGGGGGGLGTSLNSYNYENRYPNGVPGGRGGTGCIYIAWGSSMNDGS